MHVLPQRRDAGGGEAPPRRGVARNPAAHVVCHFLTFASWSGHVMFVQLCVLVLATLGVQKGFCLKCYTCLSTDPRDSCVRLDKHKIPLNYCDTSELERTALLAKKIDFEMGKLYEVHAAQDFLPALNCLKQKIQHGDKHYTLRGCQLATSDNLDICVRVKNENNDILRTTDCSLCNGDGCNAASTKKPFFSSTCATLLVLLYLKM